MPGKIFYRERTTVQKGEKNLNIVQLRYQIAT